MAPPCPNKHANNRPRTSRFEKRLQARAKGFMLQGTDQDPLLNPSIGRPALREATVSLLIAKPEADFDLSIAVSNGVTGLLYVYTLYSQICGLVNSTDSRLLRNTYMQMSTLDTMW